MDLAEGIAAGVGVAVVVGEDTMTKALLQRW